MTETNSSLTAFSGVDIFDGRERHTDAALLVLAGRVKAIVPRKAIPKGAEAVDLQGGIIAPGFVDLQVNGGGGILFNEEQSVDCLRRIVNAHADNGTTALLPTLITDTRDRTQAAIVAVAEAIAEGVPGILGLHLEGPHLSLARKGAHDPGLIRPMETEDMEMLQQAALALPNLMVTVAPESVTPEQIGELAAAGILVSLGHTDADYQACRDAVANGARCATHLFNAMSQLTSRAPGLVGAALDLGAMNAGLIADGIHVHPATIRAALHGKTGPGAVFLVTDSMAAAGTDLTEFTLNGRTIYRRGGRLTLEDGTLAGADLDMPRAVQVMVEQVGVTTDRALAMATRIPAHILGRAPEFGTLQPGARADFVHLGNNLFLKGAWRTGNRLKADVA